MQLTMKGLEERFGNGNMEIRNQKEDFFCRGRMTAVSFEDGMYYIKFVMFALGRITIGRKDHPPIPDEWKNYGGGEYGYPIGVFPCIANYIGPCPDQVGGGDGVRVVSITREEITFYPPGPDTRAHEFIFGVR